MDRTGWVRGGDRSAGQPMQRSGWIRAARYIAESFWRSVIVAWLLVLEMLVLECGACVLHAATAATSSHSPFFFEHHRGKPPTAYIA